ncbi:MAG: hypothetical protein U1E76_02835 [Planctomycetota bacterium]
MVGYRGMLMWTMILFAVSLTLQARAEDDRDAGTLKLKGLAAMQSLPLAFEENRGQYAAQTRFAARRPGITVTLAERGFAVDRCAAQVPRR